jgi:hypothetical protein
VLADLQTNALRSSEDLGTEVSQDASGPGTSGEGFLTVLIGHSSPVLCVTEDLPPGRLHAEVHAPSFIPVSPPQRQPPSDLWPPHPGDTTALPTSPQYPRVLAATPVSARNSLKDLEADKDARVSEMRKSIEQQEAEKALGALNDAKIQELDVSEMRKSIEQLEAQKVLVFLKEAKIQELEMKVLQMTEKDAKIHELQTKQASMTDELKKATENETSAVTVLKAANEVP